MEQEGEQSLFFLHFRRFQSPFVSSPWNKKRYKEPRHPHLIHEEEPRRSDF